LSGKELSDQVKTQIPEIRVIYISGYTDNQIVQNGSLQSGIHFIHKPFSINTLAGEVRRVLDLALYRNSEDNI
jgi:FixJ family two-component response regulator